MFGKKLEAKIGSMTDAEYAEWRTRQIQIASRMGKISFALSMSSLAFSLWAGGYLF